MKQFLTYSFSLILIFALNSCKKDAPVDDDAIAAIDYEHAEALFGDAALVCDEAGYKSGPFTGILSASCATVTYDTLSTTDDDTITIDFGSVGCTCNDSTARRGKMKAIYTGNYTDSGSTRTVTFTNYYMNSSRLNGSFTVTNNGPDSISGNTVFHIVSSGNVIVSTGGQINWYSVKDVEWTAGESTAGWYDNLYEITGWASGSQSTGRPFVAQISTPLLRVLSLGCRSHFTKGSVQVKPNEVSIRLMDLGEGSCDNVAYITIDGVVYTEFLR